MLGVFHKIMSNSRICAVYLNGFIEWWWARDFRRKLFNDGWAVKGSLE